MKDDEFMDATATPDVEKPVVPDEPVVPDKPKLKDRSQDFGLVGLSIFFIVLLVYNFFMRLPVYDLLAMFWGALGMWFLSKFRIDHRKANLVVAFAGIVAALVSLGNYILATWPA